MIVLFIGLGSIGVRHYKSLKKIKNKYNLEFVCYKTNKNIYNKTLIKKIDLEDIQVFEDFDSALRSKPDISIISNPTSLHIPQALKCAQNGLHLFIEKPLSNSTENTDKLVNLVKQKRLITLMGCNWRFHPALIELKKIVNSKILGKCLHFDIYAGSYLPDWRPWQDYSKSYSSSIKLGGGVTLDYIHEIDYASWIFGNIKEFKSYVSKISDLNIETEDNVDIILRTDNNIYGTISLNYFRRSPKKEINVDFEKGYIKIDLYKSSIKIESGEFKKEEIFETGRDDLFDIQMEYFISSILKQEDTENNVEYGLKILKYALKIKDSLAI